MAHMCQQDPKHCYDITDFVKYIVIEFLLSVTLLTFVILHLFHLSTEWSNDWCIPRQSCWVHGSGWVLYVLQ